MSDDERKVLVERQVQMSKDWIMFMRHSIGAEPFSLAELVTKCVHLRGDKTINKLAIIMLVAERKVVPIPDDLPRGRGFGPGTKRYVFHPSSIPSRRFDDLI